MIELGMLLLFLVLLGTLIYLDVKLDMHFTANIKEGEIYFVVRGEELHKVILGIPRSHSDEMRRNLDRRGITWSDSESSWLASHTGIHFISLLYPLIRLHEFTITAEGLKDGTKGKELPGEKAPLRDWIYHEKRKVKGLRWRFPRPVLSEKLELADRFTVDVLLMELLEVVDPYLLVFAYQGDFFRVVSSMSESAMNDMVVKNPQDTEEQSYSYTQFVALNKGEGSEFAKVLRHKINHGVESITVPRDAEHGLIASIGIKCLKAYVHKFDLSPEQKKVEEAVRAQETKRLEAEARKVEASGEAAYKRTLALAEQDRIANMLQPFINVGADPNVAADAVKTMIKTENLPQSISTWVEGDGKAVVAVPAKEGDKK